MSWQDEMETKFDETSASNTTEYQEDGTKKYYAANGQEVSEQEHLQQVQWMGYRKLSNESTESIVEAIEKLGDRLIEKLNDIMHIMPSDVDVQNVESAVRNN